MCWMKHQKHSRKSIVVVNAAKRSILSFSSLNEKKSSAMCWIKHQKHSRNQMMLALTLVCHPHLLKATFTWMKGSTSQSGTCSFKLFLLPMRFVSKPSVVVCLSTPLIIFPLLANVSTNIFRPSAWPLLAWFLLSAWLIFMFVKVKTNGKHCKESDEKAPWQTNNEWPSISALRYKHGP